ncbi:MAG: hypothetical protein E4H36_13635, partial [Spirochaetales bacterium]
MMINAARPANSKQLVQKIANLSVRYVLMVLLVLLLFGIILLVSGKDPVQSFKDIFVSTFGSSYGF